MSGLLRGFLLVINQRQEKQLMFDNIKLFIIQGSTGSNSVWLSCSADWSKTGLESIIAYFKSRQVHCASSRSVCLQIQRDVYKYIYSFSDMLWKLTYNRSMIIPLRLLFFLIYLERSPYRVFVSLRCIFFNISKIHTQS